MKKKLLALGLGLFASATAFAQLPDGSVAPDFTLKDLNGNTYNLYTLLAAGKTVFIDVSAAWCGPCWSYHNSGALEELYKQHGPTGAPGVNTNTTNDVMVLMVEGESTNTRAQLYGTSSGTSHATYSQGDWVTGTPYPIIDTNAATTTAFDQAWQIGYFPTIYMVCRDRLVQEVGQLPTAQLYAKAQQLCPTYGPSSTLDAKAVPYSGTEYFFCNATPSVKFQNYSQSNSITSATIKVLNGSTVVNTYTWSGNVAPYGVATVNIPGFSASAFAPYKYEISVTGDANAANNLSADSLFKVYSASNAVAVPASENFEGITALPYRYSTQPGTYLPFNQSGGIFTLPGANGSTTQAILVDFYNLSSGNTTEFVFGNFNSQSAANLALDFDVAYSPYTASAPENDKLEVLVSTDCGTTWTSAWSKSGTTLQTRTAATAPFIPAGASEWRHETVVLTPYKSSNMIVKFKGTSNYGNYCWLDNLKLTPTLSVSNVIADQSVRLFPNPAKDAAVLSFELRRAGKVQVSVVDAIGRVVAVIADREMTQGAQDVTIATGSLAAGTYTVKIQTEEGATTQRLSVVK